MAIDKLQLVYANHGLNEGIRRCNLDGSNTKDIVTGTTNAQKGLFYYPSRKRLYWTEVGDGYIRSTDAKGVDQMTEILFDMISVWGPNQVVPWGLALNINTDKMFWTDGTYNNIYSSNTDIPDGETYSDRTDAEKIVSGLNNVNSLNIDIINNKLYFIERGIYGESDIGDKVSRCDFDGSNIEVIISGSMNTPFGISLDVANDWIYWCDYVLGTINKANLDGTNREVIVNNTIKPIDTAIDLSNEKIYWVEYRSFPDGNIQRVNFDGSNTEVIVSGVSRPVSAIIINLEETPKGTPIRPRLKPRIRRRPQVADYNMQLIGYFETIADNVNIRIWDISDNDNTEVTLEVSGCYEIGNSNRWGWSLSNLPIHISIYQRQYVYQMITNEGEYHNGEFFA